MSYTKLLKDELLKKDYTQSCCQYAELAGIIVFCSQLRKTNTGYNLKITTENAALTRRIITLSKTLFGTNSTVNIKKHKNEKSKSSYIITSCDAGDLFYRLGLFEKDTPLFDVPLEAKNQDCCAAAFIKGAFLAAGSMANPEKRYHLEFVTVHYLLSSSFQKLFDRYGITAKSLKRKSNYVIYFKDSDSICDVLAAMGANKAVMAVYDLKVLKDVKNNVNRIVNFEKANLSKMVKANLNQLEAVKKIQKSVGLALLSPHLAAIAKARLENPDAGLMELGGMFNPPLSKSCVNHRLRKIMDIANGID